jgi:hypothetical protein
MNVKRSLVGVRGVGRGCGRGGGVPRGTRQERAEPKSSSRARHAAGQLNPSSSNVLELSTRDVCAVRPFRRRRRARDWGEEVFRGNRMEFSHPRERRARRDRRSRGRAASGYGTRCAPRSRRRSARRSTRPCSRASELRLAIRPAGSPRSPARRSRARAPRARSTRRARRSRRRGVRPNGIAADDENLHRLRRDETGGSHVPVQTRNRVRA